MIERGSIFLADLGEPVGSGPGYRRPVLVVQSNNFNSSRINTVVVIVITGNLKLTEAPGNVFLKKSDSGLSKDSVINVSQIITIDKELLSNFVGTVGNKYMKKVAEGLKTVLAL